MVPYAGDKGSVFPPFFFLSITQKNYFKAASDGFLELNRPATDRYIWSASKYVYKF